MKSSLAAGLLLLLALCAIVQQVQPLSLDPVASTELEEYIKDDFLISLRHIRPRRKFRITIEALFMIDFPESKNKFSFYLDRKNKRVTIDINTHAKVYSKNLILNDLNESTTIKSLAFAFHQSSITVYMNCKQSSTEELDVNLSKLFTSADEPTVKLFRERKYPLFLDSELEKALSRASCQKILRRNGNNSIHPRQKQTVEKMLKNKVQGEVAPERNKKRDIRNWHHTSEKYKQEIHTDFSSNRGDIPIIHGDCDENILKLLGELLKLVKELKEEVKGQRHEITYLRGLIENCAGCQQAQPLRENCQYSNPCFPGVQCYDTSTGMRCGHCPRGYVGDGRSCRPGQTCEDQPCFNGVKCYDTVEGAQCGPCPAGYEGDGKHCRFRDACEDKPCAPGRK